LTPIISTYLTLSHKLETLTFMFEKLTKLIFMKPQYCVYNQIRRLRFSNTSKRFMENKQVNIKESKSYSQV